MTMKLVPAMQDEPQTLTTAPLLQAASLKIVIPRSPTFRLEGVRAT